MKIAFNPSTVEALIAPPNNKDITFDLRGHNIFARGVKFCGTDTNTWRDIKINNVSIDSNILDLRDGSNTTLTNINGVVTINSTWRPVVDNLTSDSTTSSLSANQGRVLKALIDGKSDLDHNHDDRYLRLTGGQMLGDITFGGDNKIYWGRNTDSASISFKNDGDGDADSYMSFVTSDNGNEYFRWSHSSGSTNTEWMSLRSDGLRVGGTKVSLEGHTHDDRYVKRSGDTMLGALNFANGTWNLVGDDSYMGDCNVSGHFGIKAANTTYPGIAFFNNANDHLGNLTAYNGNIKYGAYSLQFLDNGNTSVSASTWTNPFSDYNSNAVADGQAICVWGQSSYLSNLASDSGDMSLWLKRVNANVATLNMVLDGEYYANGNQRLAHVSEIPNSLKNPYALTISLNGTSQGPYDGSAAKNINITPSSIGAATSDHNHDGRYVRYYAVTTLDCNNLAVGLTAALVSATNAAHPNHSAFLYISNVGTPFQIQIPDSSVPYIYKRYYSSGGWSEWFKLNAGYADSAGSAIRLTSLGDYTYDNLSTDIPTNAVSYKIVTSGGTDLGDSQYNVLHIPQSSGDWGTYLLFGANNGRFGVKYKHSGIVREVLDSSNYTSILNNTYLPLAGGTMNGNARIGHGSGNLYIGNSDNDGWIYIQDIASQVGTASWNIRTSGAARFGRIHIASKNDESANNNVIESDTDVSLHLNYFNNGNITLCNGGGNVGVGTTNPSSKLTVNGDISLFNVGSIRNLAIGGGIYWNPYVESTTDGSDAASITLVRQGIAGGTTLVLSQMNDANDTIQFQTNGSARLYHNSYPILTTQNTYVSNNKGYINGTEITQVNNADTVDGEHASNFVRAGVYGQSNLNSLDTYSFIRSVDSSISNTSPNGNTGWYNVIQAVHRNGADDGPNYIGQIALGMTTNINGMFYRTKYNGSWYAWNEVVTTNTGLLRYSRNNVNISSPNCSPIPPSLLEWTIGYPRLYDPEFNEGYNNVCVYNNERNGVVTVTRVHDTNVGNSSSYIIKVVSAAGASPDYGGWHVATQTELGKVYTCLFRASIPSGVEIKYYSNSIGTGGQISWLTNNMGTGKWTWYAVQVYCGSGGSTTFYFSAKSPCTWYLSYVNVIENNRTSYAGLRSVYSDYLKANASIVFGRNELQYFNQYTDVTAGATNNANPKTDWYHILRMNHANSSGYFVDLAIPFHDNRIQFRRITNGSDNGWRRVITEEPNHNVLLCDGSNSGSVGIGTTSPSYKLDVNGQVRASGFIHSDYSRNDAVLLAGGGYGRIFMMSTTRHFNHISYALSFHKLSSLCNNLVWVDGCIWNSTSTSFCIPSDFYPYLYDNLPSMRTIYRMDGNNMITIDGGGLVEINCFSYPRRIGFFYTGRA